MERVADGTGWRLRLLDHFALDGPNGSAAISSRKTIALLTYLSLQRDRSARRDALAALLWENVDPVQARVNLRQALAALRRLDEAGTIVSEATLDAVRLTADLAVDTDDFAALEADDPAAAAAIYKHDLMAGFILRDAPAFNEWLSVAQAHWRQRAVGALLRLVEASQAPDGDLNAGASAALRLLAIDPYNEAGHRALMRVYVRQGRSALAIAQYRSLSDLLRRELGVQPEAETQQAYAELRDARRTPREISERPAEPPLAAPMAAVEAEPRPAVRTPCIAVVDDEANLRDAVATYLRLAGFEVVECAGGAALDDALATRHVDLIVLDVTMPGEDGFAIARRVGAARSIPIVMLTARTDLIDRIVGLEIGADDYLGKPFELRELLARIRAVLRRVGA